LLRARKENFTLLGSLVLPQQATRPSQLAHAVFEKLKMTKEFDSVCQELQGIIDTQDRKTATLEDKNRTAAEGKQ